MMFQMPKSEIWFSSSGLRYKGLHAPTTWLPPPPESLPAIEVHCFLDWICLLSFSHIVIRVSPFIRISQPGRERVYTFHPHSQSLWIQSSWKSSVQQGLLPGSETSLFPSPSKKLPVPLTPIQCSPLLYQSMTIVSFYPFIVLRTNSLSFCLISNPI